MIGISALNTKINIMKPAELKALKTEYPEMRDTFTRNNDNLVIFNSVLTKDEIQKILDKVKLFKARNDEPIILMQDQNKEGFLCQGSVGRCFKLNTNNPKLGIKTVIVKEQVPENDDFNKKLSDKSFNNEAEFLSKIPESVQNTQKLLAFFKKDNKYYLITNFIEGDLPHPKNNPLTNSHLKVLLSTLSELDKNNILHNDLRFGNILINKEKVDIIDFGEATSIREEKRQFNVKTFNPYFSILSNVESFEMSGLFDYLNKMKVNNFSPKENREFFANYLKNKSNIHLERIKLLEKVNPGEISKEKSISMEQAKELIKKAIKHEKLQARILNNPSDEVIDIEAMKIQLGYSGYLLSRKPIVLGIDLDLAEQNLSEQSKEKVLKYYKIVNDITTSDILANFLRLNNKLNYLLKRKDLNGDETEYYKDIKARLKQLPYISDKNSMFRQLVDEMIKELPENNKEGILNILNLASLHNNPYDSKMYSKFNVAKTITDGRFETEEDKKKYEKELIKEGETEESVKDKQEFLEEVRKIFGLKKFPTEESGVALMPDPV